MYAKCWTFYSTSSLIKGWRWGWRHNVEGNREFVISGHQTEKNVLFLNKSFQIKKYLKGYGPNWRTCLSWTLCYIAALIISYFQLSKILEVYWYFDICAIIIHTDSKHQGNENIVTSSLPYVAPLLWYSWGALNLLPRWKVGSVRKRKKRKQGAGSERAVSEHKVPNTNRAMEHINHFF